MLLVPVPKPGGGCTCASVGGSKRDIAAQTTSTELSESPNSKEERDTAMKKAKPQEKRDLYDNAAFSKCRKILHCKNNQIAVSEGAHGPCFCWNVSGWSSKLRRDITINTTPLELEHQSESLDVNDKREASLETAEPERKRELTSNPAFNHCRSTHPCKPDHIAVLQGGPNGQCICWKVPGWKRDEKRDDETL